MSNYTTERKQALTSELWGLFVGVHLNAAELDSSYKHYKGSENSPYKQEMCVEIAYLSLKRHLRRF